MLPQGKSTVKRHQTTFTTLSTPTSTRTRKSRSFFSTVPMRSPSRVKRRSLTRDPGMFRLYTTPLSANGRKVLAVTHHLGLAPQIELVNVYKGEGRTPAYLS